MPKIKVLYHSEHEINWDESYNYVADSTDWVEVSDEDLQLLKNSLYRNCMDPSGRYRMSIVIEKNDQVPQLIRSAKELIERQKKQEAERLEAALKRKEKLKKSRIEWKRQQLEKLKRELGE